MSCWDRSRRAGSLLRVRSSTQPCWASTGRGSLCALFLWDLSLKFMGSYLLVISLIDVYRTVAFVKLLGRQLWARVVCSRDWTNRDPSQVANGLLNAFFVFTVLGMIFARLPHTFCLVYAVWYFLCSLILGVAVFFPDVDPQFEDAGRVICIAEQVHIAITGSYRATGSGS